MFHYTGKNEMYRDLNELPKGTSRVCVTHPRAMDSHLLFKTLDHTIHDILFWGKENTHMHKNTHILPINKRGKTLL